MTSASNDEKTEKMPKVIWRKKLANPVNIIQFSVDSWLVASVGEYDKLVKIWKRTSFDKDNVDFDFNYIPHPARILRMRWQQPFDISQSIENTLYTLADDKVIRIWAPFDSIDMGNLQLWASIDLLDHHFGLMLDNRDLSRAIESSVAANGANISDDGKLPRDLSNVISLAQSAPEICITFNKDKQTISAYKVDNVGLKNKKLAQITKIVDDQKLTLSEANLFPFKADRLDFFTYAAQANSTTSDLASLSILIHDYCGTIYNVAIDIAKLLNSDTNRERRFLLKAIITGHNKSVRRITRSGDGKLLLTQSRFSENALWKPQVLPIGVTLRKCSWLHSESGTVTQSVLVPDSDYAITLLDCQQLIVWDCRSQVAVQIGTDEIKLEHIAEPMCMLLLPEAEQSGSLHLIIVYDENNILVWSIDIEGQKANVKCNGNFPLPAFGENEKLHLAVPVDPVGWHVTVGSTLDTFQREVIITVSNTGVLRGWTARINAAEELEWLETSEVYTGVAGIVRAQVSSTKKVAITNSDCTELSIWDTSNALLEFKETFPAENSISDLDWTTTPDDQCVLGVGFAQQIVLYCQQRFDYTNKTPSWAPFRRVDISKYTSHKIGDSIWLKDGTFVVGAGNQLFVQDRNADINDETTRQLLGSRYTRATLDNISTIFDICSVLNGPLPLYHPQLLIQSILADKMVMVKHILCVLLKRLKFATISDLQVADLESNLGLDPAEIALDSEAYCEKLEGEQFEAFGRQVCDDLMEWLQKVSLPYLTRHQQITLASVIEALSYIDEQARSLDSNGIKYLLGFKLYKIHKGIQDAMSMRDFNWALHSESQNLLLDMVKQQTSTSALLWPAVREVGVAFWLRNDPLKELFELLARNYFGADEKRDPVTCSLYYLALRRKQILIGLWRTASWHKEQQKTIQLLSRDFTDDRWKSAARKNAFALLGKHRYEYAASFFLLADSLRDALNVLVKHVGDLPLAIAVARVYQGDHGSELRNLIKGHIIPMASTSGDKWLMSWALWMLKDRQAAINALAWGITDNEVDGSRTPVGGHQQPQFQGRSVSFLVDDPVLVMLYRYLQEQERRRAPSRTTPMVSRFGSPSLKPIGSGGHTPQKHVLNRDTELRFVLKTASIFCRMGCDILALDLVRRWKFFNTNNTYVRTLKDTNTSSLLDKPNDLLTTAAKIVESNPQDQFNEKISTSAKNKLQPVAAVAFEEPDMSSFNFGF
ncbi:Rav1p [Sugiyamaella lignohabitans]|uniref:Rav1p n=1 Tax=Sugiyamaella lignohabitans TaxID=796027 RepID=A0A170QYG0_9ASCO|nr:Rav1p [Sugiyamaella lignohabitans]ANB15976.1 Rav1p [Sugiyamaella lignohabitans]